MADMKMDGRSVNPLYTKMATENFKGELTFVDFMKICETLELPVFEVFEVKTPSNPFAAPRFVKKNEKYDSIMDFRKTMPDWSARNYDYEADRPTYFYEIKGIKEGEFEVTAGNNSTSYLWHFVVTGFCVVVHTTMWFTD